MKKEARELLLLFILGGITSISLILIIITIAERVEI
tara:strand:+ start:1428 stop:1535 length:108 start_codon:yes stop_codon:yes gene_type:complete